VLHVIHDPANSPGFYNSKKAGKKVLRSMEESARQMMDNFAKTHLKKFKSYETVVRSGLPATQITNFAKQKKVDLVVMGTHGRGVLDRLILGSVADKVIRQATCPVLVAREQESIEKDEEDKVEDKR
jgi:nucleotide-binding universal stress UspA family protein